MEVPADALYGASTQRAVLNFPISGERMPRRFLRALALIKLAAAQTNAELGLLDADVASAIAAAAASVADGDHDEQFPIDIYQTGSATSTNTNMNEVVAHLAAKRLGEGRKVHPNDEVNRCQSSNDVIPTALQLSAAMAIEEDLLPPSSGSTPRSWPRSRHSGRSSRPAGRTSRTRPRSGSARNSVATPGRSRSRSGARARHRPSCSRCPLGGTAVGTGINAHPEVRLPHVCPAIRPSPG
jgi:fumarate hydratase class II